MAKLFSCGIMTSESVQSYVLSGKAAIDLDDGAFVVVGDYAEGTVYGEHDKDQNVHVLTAPAAVTDTVAVVDYAGISEGVIAGNTYKMGYKLYDLKVPAGTATRVRKLDLGDKFYLGNDNFVSAPTAGQFATLTAAATVLTPAASKPASGFAVKINRIDSLTTGTKANGSRIECEVVQL
jgi:hypothetical protein